MGLIDFLKHPAGPPAGRDPVRPQPRGWDHLPPVAEKALTINGAEYVPPLVSGPGAAELLAAFGAGSRPDGNSAVFACLMALATSFFEPPVGVTRRDRSGDDVDLPTHPLVTLLARPNPWHSARELWFWVGWALSSDGNAYLQKVRAGHPLSGNVVQLVPRSPRLVTPLTDGSSGNLIDAYRFEYAPSKYEDIPPENMLHLRLGLDDRDHRLGLAPLKRLLRHVATDDEAARYAATLLGNYGIPGLLVTLVDRPTDDDAERIRQRITATYGGEGRGKVGLIGGGATMQQFGFNPEELNLKSLHQIPETRIAAILRVPPAVAGLSVGLEQTSNYASFREVREMFTEGTLVPLWSLRDDVLTTHLLPDFDGDARLRVATDLSQVRALQDDLNAKMARLKLGVDGGILTPDEARAALGYAPLPDGAGEAVRGAGAAPPMLPDGTPADPNQQPAALRVVKSLDGTDPLGAAFDRLLSAVEPALEDRVARHLASQHARARAALERGSA